MMNLAHVDVFVNGVVSGVVFGLAMVVVYFVIEGKQKKANDNK